MLTYMLCNFQMRALTQLDLNSNNPDDIIQRAVQIRKRKFLRAIAKQYVWLLVVSLWYCLIILLSYFHTFVKWCESMWKAFRWGESVPACLSLRSHCIRILSSMFSIQWYLRCDWRTIRVKLASYMHHDYEFCMNMLVLQLLYVIYSVLYISCFGAL